MKTLLLFFGIVVIIAMLESCECCSNKTVTCPGYNDAVAREWIPYNKKVQLIFATASGEKDTLRIDSIAISPQTTQQNSCKNSFCESSFTIASATANIGDKVVYLRHTVNSMSSNAYSDASVYLRFLKGDLYGTGFSTNGITMPQFSGCPTIIRFLPQTTLNAKPFTNVQEIVADTACKAVTVFKKIYLAKNKGLVGYQINTDGKLWVLQ